VPHRKKNIVEQEKTCKKSVETRKSACSNKKKSENIVLVIKKMHILTRQKEWKK